MQAHGRRSFVQQAGSRSGVRACPLGHASRRTAVVARAAMRALILGDGAVSERDEAGVGWEPEPRPGVLRLIDEASAIGLKVAVCCSESTRSSVQGSLEQLLGQARTAQLHCLLAGDDVPQPKPDPTIFTAAAKELGVQPAECIVIEDGPDGLEAALRAGMRCIITYTESTRDQRFEGAERVICGLGFPINVTARELQQQRIVQDDRVMMDVSDSMVSFLDPNTPL